MTVSSAKGETSRPLEKGEEEWDVWPHDSIGRAGIYIDRESADYQGSEAKSDRSSGEMLEKSRIDIKFEFMIL